VAAATTSLPERSAARRNWDYRYCWLRDTAFMLLILIHAGYVEEAVEWRKCAPCGRCWGADQVQTIYVSVGAAACGVGGSVAAGI